MRRLTYHVKRGLALRRAARGDHVGALSMSRDVMVLSRLGLHLAVIDRVANGASLAVAEGWAHAVAHAELGNVDAAVSLASKSWANASSAERRRFALTIARWDVHAAARLDAPLLRLERAALSLAQGDAASARLALGTAEADRIRDVNEALLYASLAAIEHRLGEARSWSRTAFQLSGLPLAMAPSQDPLALGSFTQPAPSESNSGPRVSVIMPVYNMAGTVAVAIQSVLAQRNVSVELIVVDDASTDATAEIVEDIARGQERVRFIRGLRQRGTYAARNAGLEVASGDFVAFNDADDWSHPERLARSVAPLLQGAALMATESRLVRLDTLGRFVAPRLYPLVRANRSSLVFRRHPVLTELGRFDAVAFGADEEFTARLTACFGPHSLKKLPLLLAISLQAASSLTGSKASGIASHTGLRARIAYREEWHERHVSIAAGHGQWNMLPVRRS